MRSIASKPTGQQPDGERRGTEFESQTYHIYRSQHPRFKDLPLDAAFCRKGDSMYKKLVLIVVVLTSLLVTASPALALQYGPGYYYFDLAWRGYERGTRAYPYNTSNEAIYAAEHNRYGGYVYQKTNGQWVKYGRWFYASVVPPDTGVLLSRTALLILLVVASLILIAAGWFLMRRGRTQPSRA
jgi:hypothetical protein